MVKILIDLNGKDPQDQIDVKNERALNASVGNICQGQLPKEPHCSVK
jgi:hypothetical protein